MKISYKNIFLILSTSIVIGIIYNFLNPKGVPLIKQNRKVVFESDTVLVSTETDINNNLINGQPFKSEDKRKAEKTVKDENTIKQENPAIKIEPFTEPRAIRIDLAYKLYKQGVKFIDARMPDDYAAGHIKGAYNIPFDGDESYREILNNFSKDELIVVYCSGTDCDLSIYLGNELFEKGFKRVYVFFGGWYEWIEKNYPTEKK